MSCFTGTAKVFVQTREKGAFLPNDKQRSDWDEGYDPIGV